MYLINHKYLKAYYMSIIGYNIMLHIMMSLFKYFECSEEDWSEDLLIVVSIANVNWICFKGTVVIQQYLCAHVILINFNIHICANAGTLTEDILFRVVKFKLIFLLKI